MSNKITQFIGKYRFLSNFWKCSVEMGHVIYPSVEHAYQAAKTLIKEERNAIKNADAPGKVKRLGQSVTLRPNWEKIKILIMKKLVREKFKEPNLRIKLLRTSPAKLIEGNWWNDTFWGVCKGIGQNHLGKILMEIRNEIIKNKK